MYQIPLPKKIITKFFFFLLWDTVHVCVCIGTKTWNAIVIIIISREKSKQELETARESNRVIGHDHCHFTVKQEGKKIEI